MKECVVNFGKLKPSNYNPRFMTEEDYCTLKNNIAKYGIEEPIIINEDYTIIGGHQRYRVAKELGIEELKCIMVKVDKDNERAMNIALNNIEGDTIKEKLVHILSQIDVSNLAFTGYQSAELEAMRSSLRENIDHIGENEEFDVGAIREIKIFMTAKEFPIYIAKFNQIVGDHQLQNFTEAADYLLEHAA